MKKRIMGTLLWLSIIISLVPVHLTMAAESLFDRYIPISQTYPAIVDTAYHLEPGNKFSLKIGTRFDNEMGRWSPDTQLEIKRSDYVGGFLKIKYVGTFSGINKELSVEHMELVDPQTYDEITNPPYTASFNLGLDITKDTSVVQVDLYDSNKNFVRTLSPGCIIIASGNAGEFVTYSYCYRKSHSIYFSTENNLLPEDADMKSELISFNLATATVHKKEDIEKLLSDEAAVNAAKPVLKYPFKTYPKATGKENINANILLNDHEFITPDNTYYCIGLKSGAVEPQVLHKIDNVVSYSTYNHSITPGYTQRNVVAADGTLYGITSKNEKKVIASNVKKVSINHYMTKSGEVKEIESGKVIATDCKDFAEANSAWAIGVIKNDNTFWLGYTYLGDKTAYAKGLVKKLDNAKIIVPEGVVNNKNTLYRWNETVTNLGMDENSWSMGLLVEKKEYNLNLVKVCDNVERVFPDELMSKIGTTNEEIVHQTVTGFAVTKDGTLHGYGLWYNESFGNFGMVEKIFPMRKSATEGNFVGVLSESADVIKAIVCRICDGNVYRVGPVYDKEKEKFPEFYSITRNGYLSTDGIVYSFGTDTEGKKEKELWAEPNYDRDFGQMYAKTQTFRAFDFDGKAPIDLLPSVTAWSFDNKRTCLLERSDGSVWMAALHPKIADQSILSQLDGYDNSSAIQVSKPTTQKAAPEYISVNGAFKDVKPDAYYAEAVNWAVENNITSGTSATTFSPDATCQRAQILTFLWRAVGSPKMSGANPFSDVKSTDYYYDAALWAHSKGMVSGNTFAGNTPCTRSATVVYLWKNAGSPAASYSGNFSDVAKGSDYASAVAWAVNKGVTSGTSATTFAPDKTCTRGQIVTFLLRALKK